MIEWAALVALAAMVLEPVVTVVDSVAMVETSKATQLVSVSPQIKFIRRNFSVT